MFAACWIAMLGLWTSPLADGESAGVAVRTGASADWPELTSQFSDVRRAGCARLSAMPRAEASRVAAALLESPDPSTRAAAVDRLRVLIADAATASKDDIALVVDAACTERDPTVVDRLELAVAANGDALNQLRTRLAADPIHVDRLSHAIDARLILLLEERMHFGRIPGFYDGQFAEVFALDPTAYERLVRVAWDPRLNYVLRSLTIVALHEPRRPDLYGVLQGLLLRPDAEIDIQDHVPENRAYRESDQMLLIAASLSQYTRFALAKAGIAEPIDQKIGLLEVKAKKLEEQTARVRLAYFPDSETGSRILEWQLDQLMDAYFELGYHHQQLDRYELAEKAYRRITEQPERLTAKRWAYYNLACIHAIKGDRDGAIEALADAVDAGFNDLAWAAKDGDLTSLREDPRFLRLISGVRAGAKPAVKPPR